LSRYSQVSAKLFGPPVPASVTARKTGPVASARRPPATETAVSTRPVPLYDGSTKNLTREACTSRRWHRWAVTAVDGRSVAEDCGALMGRVWRDRAADWCDRPHSSDGCSAPSMTTTAQRATFAREREEGRRALVNTLPSETNKIRVFHLTACSRVNPSGWAALWPRHVGGVGNVGQSPDRRGLNPERHDRGRRCLLCLPCCGLGSIRAWVAVIWVVTWKSRVSRLPRHRGLPPGRSSASASHGVFGVVIAAQATAVRWHPCPTSRLGGQVGRRGPRGANVAGTRRRQGDSVTSIPAHQPTHRTSVLFTIASHRRSASGRHAGQRRDGTERAVRAPPR
jgi:hypothetical protein